MSIELKKPNFNSKNPDIKEFVDLFLRCPETKKIFDTPTITAQGKIYEQDIIYKLDVIKPDEDALVVIGLKSFISSFLDTYPEFKEEQYKPGKTINHHSANIKKVQNLFEKEKYSELKNYTLFSMRYLSESNIGGFLNKATPDLLKYFIDNTVNLSEKLQGNGAHLVNYICWKKMSDLNIIKYIFEKGGQMNLGYGGENITAIQQVIKACGDDNFCNYAINKFLEEGGSLFQMNGSGLSFFNFVMSQRKSIIMHALSKVDITSDDFRNNLSSLLNSLEEHNGILNDTEKGEISEVLFSYL